MLRRVQSWLLIGGWLVAAVAAAQAGGHNEPLTTAELLVDLARDYGLNRQGQQTPADVQHVRALLQAAVRVDRRLPDSYIWMYELAALAGDQEEAARLLAELVAADPTHEGAFARWLDAGLRAQQTMEKRVQWLEAVAAAHRPPVMAAVVHVALARLALERMEPAEARRHLARALELEPASPEAAALALDAVDPNAGAAQRLRAALRLLQRSPLSVPAAWQVALILDDYGIAEEAGRFYEHALSVHRRMGPRGPAPAGFLLGLARNLLGRGQVDEAIAQTRAAIRGDSSSAVEAGLFLHYLLTRGGYTAEATSVQEQLASRFAAIREPADFPANELAQAAWFYCTLDPQPDRALMLAKAAAERAPSDLFVQRVLGWAHAANLRIEEAERTLLPLAGRDPYAASLLAKLMRAAGDESSAQRVLDSLDPKPSAGPAFDLLYELEHPAASQRASASRPGVSTQPAATTQQAGVATRPSASTHPAGRSHPEIDQALAEFDDRVFEFYRAPARFLDAQADVENRSLTPGQPWWAVFTLTNRGPFPITLGADAMLNPVFLLSFTVEGDKKREFPALMTVSIDRTRVLDPGESVRLRRTIDIGPLRRIARETPQQLQRVTMNAVLDAEQGPDGQWQPALGGQALPSVYFNRVPAGTAPETLSALFSDLSSGPDPARFWAVEWLAELLGERQRADLKRLAYEPGPVPAERLRSVLVGLLNCEPWELRVRTLEALQIVGLDRPMVNAVEKCLEHPQWLVRMMALRVLARQGSSFAERAATLARNDPDELVRSLADSFVKRWAAGREAGASDKK